MRRVMTWKDVILHDSGFCGPNFFILLWMNIALGLDVRHIALYSVARMLGVCVLLRTTQNLHSRMHSAPVPRDSHMTLASVFLHYKRGK
ncbi:unnamed protein product [Boreogadus saida]